MRCVLLSCRAYGARYLTTQPLPANYLRMPAVPDAFRDRDSSHASRNKQRAPDQAALGAEHCADRGIKPTAGAGRLEIDAVGAGASGGEGGEAAAARLVLEMRLGCLVAVVVRVGRQMGCRR